MSNRVVIEWMGAQIDTLADLLPESPRAVIVGINPAPVSVEIGHYYQGKLGHRLWDRLRRCGLVSPTMAGWEDDEAVASGFGFTDVVKRPTESVSAIRPGEREHGARLLTEKLVALNATTVIFTFKAAALPMLGSI